MLSAQNNADVGKARHTILVEGLLAYRTERARAAKVGAIGREILTVSQLAARLAGGFLAIAGPDVLYPAISAALAEGGFSDLSEVAALPGMPRAIAATLAAIWASDLSVSELAATNDRVADILLVINRVRATLPPTFLTPPDLRDAAMGRAGFARAIFGDIEMAGICQVDPVWRPLIAALGRQTRMTWRAPDGVDTGWFDGELLRDAHKDRPTVQVYSCADPRSEVIEALRWVRQRLSVAGTMAPDIALTAASTAQYDENFLVLREQAKLPIHFVHGIPALSTSDGQACAALADVLLRGLDQDRVRRLVRLWPNTPTSALLPADWAAGLHAEAVLLTADHWAAALQRAATARSSGDLAEKVLLPVLRLIERGGAAATEIGDLLLRGESLAIWQRALRSAPAAALAQSLQQMRLPDPYRDAADSVAWCSSDDLAASPRPIVRMLGLTVGSWPRQDRDDPLLPAHIIDQTLLRPITVTARDRSAFTIISGRATELALSSARRNTRGGLQSVSPLWPKADVIELGRLRTPEHALDETDRLLARPKDAVLDPRVTRSRSTWRDWQRPELTPSDGMLPASHPLVVKALARTNSATSLRLMLRDPQSFVWAHAFGWHPRNLERQPLSLDPRAFGELVHELLSTVVRKLDVAGGVQRASQAERDAAMSEVADAIGKTWPLERPVPPSMLWTAAIDAARQLAMTAIEVDEAEAHRFRSWTEVSFGDADAGDAPWEGQVVRIPGTDLAVHGRIDRLDLADNRSAARITDYKTSRLGRTQIGAILDGGRELQRVLYAVAARQLMPDVSRIVARLTFLRDGGHSERLAGDELEQAIADLAGFATAASSLLDAGGSLPGPDALDTYSRYRLARPAELQRYMSIKSSAREDAQAGLLAGWALP